MEEHTGHSYTEGHSGGYFFEEQKKELSELQQKLAAIDRELRQKGILTFDNPLHYRGYLIYHSTHGYGGKYEFVHEEYDGAPDAHDHRLGSGKTIEECVIEINQQLEEL